MLGTAQKVPATVHKGQEELTAVATVGNFTGVSVDRFHRLQVLVTGARCPSSAASRGMRLLEPEPKRQTRPAEEEAVERDFFNGRL
jgi:hypothetical protein